ncbi:MAG TPA: DUF2292 domain-containing protein [Solimonas sp.]
MSLEAPTRPLDANAQRELLRALDGLRFGTVEITVHNGRIVQIERREKVRLDDLAPARPPNKI